MNKVKNIFKKLKNKFIEYWIGFVIVNPHYIYTKGTKQLYYIDLYIGKYKKAYSFSGVGKEALEQIVNDWKYDNSKGFNFHLDYDYGYQDYTLTRIHKDILVAKLEDYLSKEWYEESIE